jgi:hypothetical protein
MTAWMLINMVLAMFILVMTPSPGGADVARMAQRYMEDTSFKSPQEFAIPRGTRGPNLPRAYWEYTTLNKIFNQWPDRAFQGRLRMSLANHIVQGLTRCRSFQRQLVQESQISLHRTVQNIDITRRVFHLQLCASGSIGFSRGVVRTFRVPHIGPTDWFHRLVSRIGFRGWSHGLVSQIEPTDWFHRMAPQIQFVPICLRLSQFVSVCPKLVPQIGSTHWSHRSVSQIGFPDRFHTMVPQIGFTDWTHRLVSQNGPTDSNCPILSHFVPICLSWS